MMRAEHCKTCGHFFVRTCACQGPADQHTTGTIHASDRPTVPPPQPKAIIKAIDAQVNFTDQEVQEFSAAEARRRSEATGFLDEAQLAHIFAKISEATPKRQRHIFFYSDLDPWAHARLVKLGYTIGPPQWDRNEVLIKISW
jgi:hypothetical protein